jgi:hypothetical protein
VKNFKLEENEKFEREYELNLKPDTLPASENCKLETQLIKRQ